MSLLEVATAIKNQAQLATPNTASATILNLLDELAQALITNAPATDSNDALIVKLQAQLKLANADNIRYGTIIQDLKTILQMPEILPDGSPGTMNQLVHWAKNYLTIIVK